MPRKPLELSQDLERCKFQMMVCPRLITDRVYRSIMCHNISTRSVHCDDAKHHEYRTLYCKKMWYATWEIAVTCKTQRDMEEILAYECQKCLHKRSLALVKPWTAATDDVTDQDSDSIRDSSPESPASQSSSNSDNGVDETLKMVRKGSTLSESFDSASNSAPEGQTL